MAENGYDIIKIFIRKLRPGPQEIVSGIAGQFFVFIKMTEPRMNEQKVVFSVETVSYSGASRR